MVQHVAKTDDVWSIWLADWKRFHVLTLQDSMTHVLKTERSRLVKRRKDSIGKQHRATAELQYSQALEVPQSEG